MEVIIEGQQGHRVQGVVWEVEEVEDHTSNRTHLPCRIQPQPPAQPHPQPQEELRLLTTDIRLPYHQMHRPICIRTTGKQPMGCHVRRIGGKKGGGTC